MSEQSVPTLSLPIVEIHIGGGIWEEIPLMALRPGTVFRIRHPDGELVTNQFGQPVILQAASFPMVEVQNPVVPDSTFPITFAFQPQATQPSEPEESPATSEGTPG